MIRAQWRVFLTAVMFLTRIPVCDFADHDPGWLARSLAYWPLIGGLLGAAAGGVFWGLSILGFSGWTAAIFAVATVPILTGCFHEDGFADVCDGFGGYTPEQRRTILKDSRVGSFAVVGVVLLLSAMVSVLADLSPLKAGIALVLAHTWGRWTAGFATWVLPGVADPNSLAKPLVTELKPLAILVSTAFAAAISWTGGPTAIISCLTVSVLISVSAGFWLRKWLGGLTGDGLGATNMLVQLAVLMVAAKTL